MSTSVNTHRPSAPPDHRWLRFLLIVLALVIVGGVSIPLALAQEKHPASEQMTAAEPGAHEEAHHEGLTTYAPLIDLGIFKVTNSMIVTWIVALGIIAFAQFATRRIKEVPDGAQNFWEWLVESLHNFLESIIGHELIKKTFWFFATIFIFILFTNWFGLLPGVGTIGWGIPDALGGLHHIDTPLFRGVNADLNMTLAMAVTFFACWIWWALQAHGFGGVVMHIFGPKGKTEGFMKVLMIVVFALVGCLEVVTILFRPVTLSFRLFGNVFAGENLLESMANIVPGLAWLIPVPFYFMELLVGLVQALVFMLLTAVFTMLICQHEEEHH
ncbi:MAG: F-type H+-transporting ATPase subunit a [Chthoniobacter sp.]|jgi:F-type H+-transporting ATPase subunit a|nr:F-type H+-transporting ATPase subunit a [Chthoniobacter sp.]